MTTNLVLDNLKTLVLNNNYFLNKPEGMTQKSLALKKLYIMKAIQIKCC